MFEESLSTIPSILSSLNNWLTPTVLFLLLNLMIGTIVVTSAFTSSAQNHKQSPEDHHHQQQEHQQLYEEAQEKLQLQPLLIHRSPSVLQRLKSINFYTFRSQFNEQHQQHHVELDQEQLYEENQKRESINLCTFRSQELQQEEEKLQPALINRSPSILQRLKSINFNTFRSQELEIKQSNDENHSLSAQEPDSSPLSSEPEEQTLDQIYSKIQSRHVSRTRSDTEPASGEPPARLLPGKMNKSASLKSSFTHFEYDDDVEYLRPATVREGKAQVAEMVRFVNDGDGDDDGSEVDARADDFIIRFKHQLKLQKIDSLVRKKGIRA